MFANFVVIVIWILSHRPGRESKLLKNPLSESNLAGGIFILDQGGSLILVQGGKFAWRTGATRTGFSKNSKNENSHYPMDFYTFDMLGNLFDFPKEIIIAGCNGDDCGPIFFPKDYRRLYKIKFRYKVVENNKKLEFVCGCNTMLLPYPWEEYNEVIMNNILKLKNKKL